jgi:hypothetical protein
MSLSLGGNPGGGGSQLPLLMVSVSALSVSAGLAFYLMQNKKGSDNKSNMQGNGVGSVNNTNPVAQNATGTQSQIQTGVPLASADGRTITLPSPPPEPTGAEGLDGRYNIKYGALSLTVDPSSCDKTYVWFDESASNDAMRFNLRSVPGYQGVYTIESEDRVFSKGCGRAFLTITPMCGQLTLEEPGLKDRQYFKFVQDAVKGGYAIMSMHCYNKRQPAFMISSGQNAGLTNQPRFISSPSAVYSLIKAL